MSTLVLDPQAIENLIAEIDEDTALMIMESFMKECRERRDNMDTLAVSQDYETLEREAHSMKSSAKSFGAMQLSQLGYDIEMACRNKDTDTAHLKTRQVPELIDATLEALESWKAQRA